MDDFDAEPAKTTRKVTGKPRAPRAVRPAKKKAAGSVAKKAKKTAVVVEASPPAPEAVSEDVTMEEALPPAAFSQNWWLATGFRQGGQRLERDVTAVTHAKFKPDAKLNMDAFARENGHDVDGYTLTLIPRTVKAGTVVGSGKVFKTYKGVENENEPTDEQRLFYSVGHDVSSRFLREHGNAPRIFSVSKDKEGAGKYIKHFVASELGGNPDIDFGLYRIDPKENHTCILVSGGSA